MLVDWLGPQVTSNILLWRDEKCVHRSLPILTARADGVFPSDTHTPVRCGQDDERISLTRSTYFGLRCNSVRGFQGQLGLRRLKTLFMKRVTRLQPPRFRNRGLRSMV